MSRIRAVVFDLYGTLIRLQRSPLSRDLPGRLGMSRRHWSDLVRHRLLVTPFASREAFVDQILRELDAPLPDGLRQATLDLLDEEVGSARPFVGVLPMLTFLKRRGFLLGLISNLASPYREPFARLGFAELFDAVAFSCEEGRTKPDPRIYAALCNKLGVAPGEAVMVGDSRVNDVEAARRAGLDSLWAGRTWNRERTSTAGIGWRSLVNGHGALIEPGCEVVLAHEKLHLLDLEPVPDHDQGRYNLVAAGTAEGARGACRRVFFKRFLLPESAHVEAFAHTLLAEAGIETSTAGVLDGPEPVFWSYEVPGAKLGTKHERPPASAALAFEVGRHCAAAFLFANADLRPRNAFLASPEPRPKLVMVDHEHCLFNLALDPEGLSDPFDPHVLDALGAPELERRVAKRVLSAAAMRRAVRAFLDTRGASSAVLDGFRRGWSEVHERARRRRARIEALLRARIYTEPYLVVGTRSWRRAMAGVDVDDLLARVDTDPRTAVEAVI